MYIGIDVGGTSIKLASFKTLSSPKAVKVIEFKTQNNYKNDFDNLAKAISELAKSKVGGIGIGIAAVLNEEKTQMLKANNIKSWEKQTIKDDLENLFKCKIILENDATCAALGEAKFGYGQGKDFIFITWGTGIGGTCVRLINNQVNTVPCELGHQIVQWQGIFDNCGQQGCLEAYCGGNGIARLYGKSAKNLSENEWREVEQRFAHGLLNVLAINPVNLVIFAGSVALNQKKKLENIEVIVRDKLKIFQAPQFLISKYQNDIGLYGAIALLRR